MLTINTRNRFIIRESARRKSQTFFLSARVNKVRGPYDPVVAVRGTAGLKDPVLENKIPFMVDGPALKLERSRVSGTIYIVANFPLTYNVTGLA